MRLSVAHETRYCYERPVRSLIQAMRLTPRPYQGLHLLRWRIEPDVDGRLRPKEDALGNVVHLFSSDGAVEEMTVRVVGEVETSDTDGLVRGAVERVPELVFLRESELTLADPEIQTFARDVTSGARDPLTLLHRLIEAVHREMTFDVDPTDVVTTAREAFALRRGVCQDLSHVFIAGARHLGIPARYVSGYFFRSDGVVDQDAGHAWAEVKVPDLGWVGFDPANGISTTDAHVRVAVGLDYLGAAPIRGSRIGGGSETMKVKLRVESMHPAQTQSQGPGQGQSQSQR